MGERRSTGTSLPWSTAATAVPPWVLVRGVLAVVLLGFFLVGLSDLLTRPDSAVEATVTLVALVVLMVIQVGYFARPAAALDRRTSAALLGVQAVLTLGMPLLYGNQWAALPGLLAGSALLVLPRGWRWAAFAAVLLLGLPRYGSGLSRLAAESTSVGPVIVLYTSIGALITGLVVFGLCRLAGLVVDLRDSEEELVQAAAAEERLRLSADLDRTIGRRLAEIIVRGEVVQNRPGRPADRVVEELDHILSAARHALTDARAIASRYRTLSLSGELRSAEQVLGQAGIRAAVECDVPRFPAEVETALAVAVREGVTELMRGRSVQECVIDVRGRNDPVRLEIRDTGAAGQARVAPPRDGPATFPGTHARVSRLGGSVDVRQRAGEPFRLDVRIPARLEPAGRGIGGGTARLVAAIRSGGRREVASTQAVAAVVLSGFFAVAAVRAFPAVPDPAGRWATLTGLALITGVQVAVLVSRRATAPVRRAAWILQVAVLGLPLLVGVPAWISLPGVVAGAAFLTWPLRAAWPLALAVLAGAGAVQYSLGVSAFELVFVTVSAVNSAVTTWALVQLAWLVRSVHAGRDELAAYAVLTERLRVLRDVHDLLGLNLSAIVLKGELAHRLAGRDAGALEAELSGIVQIARSATGDLAAVTQGGPLASLRNELDAIRSILTTADVALTERVEDLRLEAAQVDVCVAVLREGLTNMLRHSKVENCEIVLAREPAGGVLVQLTNDGAAAAPVSAEVSPQPLAPGGSGLRNLAERVATLHGTLEVDRDDDHHRLTVRLPPVER